jgi:hypothetical protein
MAQSHDTTPGFEVLGSHPGDDPEDRLRYERYQRMKSGSDTGITMSPESTDDERYGDVRDMLGRRQQQQQQLKRRQQGQQQSTNHERPSSPCSYESERGSTSRQRLPGHFSRRVKAVATEMRNKGLLERGELSDFSAHSSSRIFPHVRRLTSWPKQRRSLSISLSGQRAWQGNSTEKYHFQSEQSAYALQYYIKALGKLDCMFGASGGVLDVR